MSNDLISFLKSELKLLEDARKVLNDSYNSCKKIGIKIKYSKPELEKYEALTSRFARTSDVFIQKILRLIDEIDLEPQVPAASPRDRINLAEKKGIVENGKILIEIRNIRNKIAHEYNADAIKNIFKTVLDYTPSLLNSIDRLNAYCQKYFK